MLLSIDFAVDEMGFAGLDTAFGIVVIKGGGTEA